MFRKGLFNLLFIFVVLFSSEFVLAQSKIVVFDIKEEIAPSATRLVGKALQTAKDLNADLVLINMDTYGGLVADADSIRYSILNSKVPVVVYINPNAASAGALISIACKHIYMSKGASIGAATVVTQEGTAAPDKYQSYMRSLMRSTAEAHGKKVTSKGDTVWIRNPEIAEAMVDEDIEIKGITEKGKVLTFTPEEAIRNGFCEGIKNSIEEVISAEGYQDYTIIKVEKNFIDIVFGFLKNPAVSSILVMLIIGGIYYELRTPGIGFPIIVSIVSALLYFAPNYIDGLADNWEILLFIAGVVLLLIELFAIPGFGIIGLIGIASILSGLVLSLLPNEGFDFSIQSPSQIGNAFLIVSVALAIFIGLLLYSGISLHKSTLIRKMSLESDLTASIQDNSEESINIRKGEIGVAITEIKPQGKAMIHNRIINVNSISGFIPKGSEVVFIKREGRVWLIERNLSEKHTV
ncbi:MAG: nodulation protein NfeD [Bacteroidetes bacterium]|nr:nodulation protein NfeD [Bacteroidota bacterium]